jgi:hypothetical protein
MNLKLEFDVTITRHESGAYLAACDDFPRKVGIGDTPEDALAHLRSLALRPVLQPIRPHPPGTDPWAILPGLYPNDELTQEWERLVRERRDVYDDPEPERGR